MLEDSKSRAELLQRVFKVDGWRCPHCKQPMRLRSIVIVSSATSMGPPHDDAQIALGGA